MSVVESYDDGAVKGMPPRKEPSTFSIEMSSIPGTFLPDNILDSLEHILGEEYPAPEKPLSAFELSEEAAWKNFHTLRKVYFHLGREEHTSKRLKVAVGGFGL